MPGRERHQRQGDERDERHDAQGAPHVKVAKIRRAVLGVEHDPSDQEPREHEQEIDSQPHVTDR
jgi:hypothetical protein